MAETFRITPLGAAHVEAMPDRKKRARLQHRYDEHHECPTSEIFPTIAEVETFYRKQGQTIRGVQHGFKSNG